MAPLVGRLEKRKLIERRPLDGRSHALQLTPSGRALTLRAQKVMTSHEEQLSSRIPPELRTAFLAVLQALWDTGK